MYKEFAVAEVKPLARRSCRVLPQEETVEKMCLGMMGIYFQSVGGSQSGDVLSMSWPLRRWQGLRLSVSSCPLTPLCASCSIYENLAPDQKASTRLCSGEVDPGAFGLAGPV